MTHCYQLSISEREEISLGLAQGLSKNYLMSIFPKNNF